MVGLILYKIRCLVILRISLVTAIVSLQLCIPPYDVYNFTITKVSGRCIISPSVTAFIALQLKVNVSIQYIAPLISEELQGLRSIPVFVRHVLSILLIALAKTGIAPKRFMLSIPK